MLSVLAVTGIDTLCLAAIPVLSSLLGLWPYLVMLLGFSFIVFVHELGHFGVAKWAGVRVERFAVGFGRELFGFTRGETRYSFNILPLGGYVKMLGQEDFDDKSKELMFNDNPRSFVNKPVAHRMAIVSAGVIMNVLLAGVLFMVVFLIGMQSMGTRIAYVEPDSPAEWAGILPGDIIREMNGSKVMEFKEVQMGVMLARLHEPIDFVVERDGQLKSFSVIPRYLIPENTREAQRLVIGISPGVTRKIRFVGPEIDVSKPDSPHVDDTLVEIDGVEITDDNVSEVIHMLAYAKGDVFVERADPKNPDAPPQRVRVNIPPILTLYPYGKRADSISILGLAPLVRLSRIDPRGRAFHSGLEIGDTVLSFDDISYPTRAVIMRAIRESAERDIHFKVQKIDGRIAEGFVRPKRNKRGPSTLQAICDSIVESEDTAAGPHAYFSAVRRLGVAAAAGLEAGDVILSCDGMENPTAEQVRRAIRKTPARQLSITVRKGDGSTLIAHAQPVEPGSIDARFNLVAEDVLRVSEVVATLNGRPSPAAQAGLPSGVLITAINSQPVRRWRELTDAFRAAAGTTVELAYREGRDQAGVVSFRVPSSLRTLLGIGPEARILSIDGRRTVMYKTTRGPEEVSVGFRGGTRQILTELVGRSQVPVEYRANPLADVQTGYVDVTTDMVDPWVGHIAFSPNIDVAAELTLLKGKNAFDAVRIGIHKTYYFIVQVYTTMERMIFSRSVGVENISGPLGIIDVGGKIARAGFVEFIFFMAIISANLAVINFLPLPIVDGGLMIFLIIEKIKGSPVSLRVQIATQMVGIFLIIGVFLWVTFNDAMKMWG